MYVIVDTLALIAGLGGLQANRQRSFKRFPPPSSSFSRQASAEQTADQEQPINNVPSGSEAQTNETSCLKEGATKRKWTRSIQARTSASSLTQAIAETKVNFKLDIVGIFCLGIVLLTF